MGSAVAAARVSTEERCLRARSRTLRHPSGNEVETPLLVPSFSSKGFDVEKRKDGGAKLKGRPRSEASKYLQLFGNSLIESFLVSAYDIHYDLFDDLVKVRSKYESTVMAGPSLVFLDSGLYEARPGSDAGEAVQEMRLPADWDEAMYSAVVDSLPADGANIAVVSWDTYTTYRKQIEAAQEFFATRRGHLSVLLLKPEKENAYYDVAKLTPDATRLAAFGVIGVTEKELGGSVIERAATIARLRDLLDEADVDAPIHVFGGLDPLDAPLYFAAGAEIFDGLTWLRYAFVDGIAVRRDSWPLLHRQVDIGADQRTLATQSHNLDALRLLIRSMKRFTGGEGWTVYGERTASLLQDAYLDLESELRN
jgi:hypothetical protein